MKNALRILLLAGVFTIACAEAHAAAVSDYPAGLAASGIASSRHNLGGFGKVLHTNATTEICVFCHTPHHSNAGPGSGPLWNRSNSSSASYSGYGATIGGSSVGAPGGATLACLSCHDGVTTFDNIVNAPGKGGLSATPGVGENKTWIFRMPIETMGAASQNHDFFNTALSGPGTCANCHSGDNPAVRLSLGTELSNDHPVSVAYSTDRAGLRPTNTTINAIDLTSELASSAGAYASGNLAQNRWAVKGFISDTATIADLLRDGKVECTSCHDPHFRNLSWDEVESSWTSYWDDGQMMQVAYMYCTGEACTDGNFLRRVGGNTGSGVCRTCHEK
ncbi:MAG: hypothetical protein HYV24_10460 [Deltaproteobacteria bacterium]|nr:hypothetical protein [Deltaproteobacteria bacterium]